MTSGNLYLGKTMIADAKIKACVGCGYCCKTAPCALAVRIYGNITSCPELIWDEDAHRYWCRACKGEGGLRAEYRAELFIGAGCCSPLNSDRKNIPAPPRKIKNVLSSESQIFLSALAKEWISGDVIYFILMRCKQELGDEWVQAASCLIKEQRDSKVTNFMG